MFFFFKMSITPKLNESYIKVNLIKQTKLCTIFIIIQTNINNMMHIQAKK